MSVLLYLQNVYYPSPRNPNLIAIVPVDEPTPLQQAQPTCPTEQVESFQPQEDQGRVVSYTRIFVKRNGKRHPVGDDMRLSNDRMFTRLFRNVQILSFQGQRKRFRRGGYKRSENRCNRCENSRVSGGGEAAGGIFVGEIKSGRRL